MGSDESHPSVLRVMGDRCSELEASQASLLAQLGQVTQSNDADDDDVASYYGQKMVVKFPGKFRSGEPYSHVLQCINLAVHVTHPSTGEIIYWNRAAEKLYGWKDYEAVGQSFWDLLIEDEYAPYMNKIRGKLQFGQSWSGQFPFKKRSGEIFMALVTESPLYEDGELIGVITVSSDAMVYNSINSDQHRVTRNNMKRIQWQQRPQITLVPQMTSSISDLASKVVGHICKDDILRDEEGFVSNSEGGHRDSRKNYIAKNTEDVKSSHTEESVITQPVKMASKLLAKFRKLSTGNNVETTANIPVQNDFRRKEDDDETFSVRGSPKTTFNSAADVRRIQFPGKITYANENMLSYGVEKAPSLEEFHQFSKEPKLQTSLPALGFLVKDRDADHDFEKSKASKMEPAAQRQTGAKGFPSSGENISGTPGSSLSKGDGNSNAVVDCDIRWEDLQLGEEIGQGSYAVVYHGLWNGSDVAIKVYFDKGYNEGTLLGYKKEIGIMRKLRHPNVLLFMGACYSQERLAIVTEFLPRGSLFKILHRSNQVLDLRRRLRMALDVARGMNYLHHRNPPIVHRDLKSSNLLVDKKWNVKVGDFGLSKLKNATFLTAKSGGGTPQWMAPEVLRNDPSNEKSDVFSFGVILWELVTVKIPWDSLNALQVVAVVGFMDQRLDLPENLDPRILSIIKDCWQSKPELRPSFEDIIQRMTGILHSYPPTATPPVQKSSSLTS